MTVRDKLLEIFENGREIPFSGEELSERLGVSRNAVWKAVKQLKEEGYEISSSKKDGYTFSAQNDILSPAMIRRSFREELPVEIDLLQSVDSTNNLLKRRAAEGAKEGSVVIAQQQTAGKGRMGRKFYSPENTGLYISILLRPEIAPDKALYITTAAAVAAAKAIEEVSGKSIGIKWVNDLFLDRKKCCGILTEASLDLESGGLEYAVLGVGVNLCPPEKGFPEELNQIAGAVFDETPSAQTKARLAAGIIERFFESYKQLEQKPFLTDYQTRSILTGKEICICSDPPEDGFVLGIDEEFGLKVRTKNGEKTLRSGEVSVRPKP